MHLIVAGATGLVGSAVLESMIKMKDVTRISILSRRPVKMAEDAKDPRVNVIIHKDFEKYDKELMDKIQDASGCVWALGISQSSVSKEDYIKITKDYAIAAAQSFQELASDKQPFHFVYVSGDGATFEPGRFSPLFAGVKGETELLLSEMRKANPSFHVSTVRPSAVDWTGHAGIKPYMPAQGLAKTALLGALRPILSTVATGRWSPTAPLGQFLTEMAMGKWDDKLTGPGIQNLGAFPVLENSAFRRLAGLDAK